MNLAQQLVNAYTALAAAEGTRDSALAAYDTSPSQANANAVVQAVASVAAARQAYQMAYQNWADGQH